MLLPPRSNVDSPQYYANGPEVPAALRTLESIGASSNTLDDEIDEQLVGIARLVNAPAESRAAREAPAPDGRIGSAQQRHRAARPRARGARRPAALRRRPHRSRVAAGAPLVGRIVHAGDQLVFVSGNHDSDALERQLARAGAIVLTRAGRLLPDGKTGPVVNEVGGLRIAGYDDPLMRLAADGYRDNGATPTEEQQARVLRLAAPLLGRIDVVMVHEPGLAKLAIDALRKDPPKQPLLVVWGHTHAVELAHAGTLTTLNPGSVGGGGTGNLADVGGNIGLARLIYRSTPRFEPLAADLVQIDPGNGAAQARRYRLDEPAATK